MNLVPSACPKFILKQTLNRVHINFQLLEFRFMCKKIFKITLYYIYDYFTIQHKIYS